MQRVGVCVCGGVSLFIHRLSELEVESTSSALNGTQASYALWKALMDWIN